MHKASVCCLALDRNSLLTPAPEETVGRALGPAPGLRLALLGVGGGCIPTVRPASSGPDFSVEGHRRLSHLGSLSFCRLKT